MRKENNMPKKKTWDKERKKQLKELDKIKGKGHMPGGYKPSKIKF